MRLNAHALGLPLIAGLALAAPPQTIHDLTILLSAPGVQRLTWSPVSTDTQGNALLDVSYDIHRGSQPDFLPGADTWAGHTHDPEFTDTQQLDRGFYRVVARGFHAPQPDLVAVPAGSFMMGHPTAATPEHLVALSGAYQVGRREVTNAEFLEAAQWALDQGHAEVAGGDLVAYGRALLMMSGAACEIVHEGGHLVLRASAEASQTYPAGYNPANHPVKMVTWFGAACFCDWLSMMSGLQPYYQGDFTGVPGQRNPYEAAGYRLPTEAEWEFAAQYDNERNYPWGNQAPNCTRVVYTNCTDWSFPVGSKPGGANALGILDMAGNAYEWCNDWSEVYTPAGATDPVGALSGDYRIIRGGGWDSLSTQLYLAQRYHSEPLDYYISLGFRVARPVN